MVKRKDTSEMLKNKWKNPQFREMMAQKNKERWEKPNEEFKEKLSKAMKKNWTNQEYRENQLDKHKNYIFLEEHRENLSKALKKRWDENRIDKSMIIRKLIESHLRRDIDKKELEIINLYNTNYNITKIAKLMNCDFSVIKRILLKNNIILRPQKFYTKGRAPWIKGKHHNKKTKLKIKNKRIEQIFPVKDTSIEVKIQNFLKALGIDFFTHQYIKEIEHGYQCDILIPSMNMVIECDGDYWHKYPAGTEIDNIRTSELLQKGFRVLRLWEKEIKIMDLNKFQDKLTKL